MVSFGRVVDAVFVAVACVISFVDADKRHSRGDARGNVDDFGSFRQGAFGTPTRIEEWMGEKEAISEGRSSHEKQIAPSGGAIVPTRGMGGLDAMGCRGEERDDDDYFVWAWVGRMETDSDYSIVQFRGLGR